MKAILKNGAICPKEAVPSDWSEGTELDVQKSMNGAPDLEAQYRRLRAQWHSETRVLSDPAKIMGHPAMRAIIALGEEVVPIILRDLQADPSLMVWALPKIVGASPQERHNPCSSRKGKRDRLHIPMVRRSLRGQIHRQQRTEESIGRDS